MRSRHTDVALKRKIWFILFFVELKIILSINDLHLCYFFVAARALFNAVDFHKQMREKWKMLTTFITPAEIFFHLKKSLCAGNFE